jgi:hypothetical protein
MAVEYFLTILCSIRDYLLTSNVQMGGTYEAGKIATSKVNKGNEAGARYINALPDEVGE